MAVIANPSCVVLCSYTAIWASALFQEFEFDGGREKNQCGDRVDSISQPQSQ
jgi:hypothetical protein